MNPIKQKVDTVFYEAIGLSDSARRSEFLDQTCAEDAALRDMVEKKLNVCAEAEGFFAKARSALFLPPEELQNFPADANEAKPDERVGTHIGSYKLLQKIGEGGCGTVYLAEQEQPVRRRVALKVIKLGMDTKRVIDLFAAERQALALMDHPNIARVLDAGATEAGRPYFVMELVRGVKITKYCDELSLDTQQRLRLFIQVCHAIQHAHQKGIIHRDIKPSNILVTILDGEPMPKIIDFGIAKAIEGRLTDLTLFTGHVQVMGTPAYMSPEQAETDALDVDTRSDVYSLGVLLYELLTGRTPFEGKALVQSGIGEMRRRLREMEPRRLSNMLTTLSRVELETTAANRHIEPAKLISTLKGDLDWIVMMALKKDRSRRYETVHGLLMDVQRYLNHEPVRARPPSPMYRLQKLVRRNKFAVISGAAVGLALLMGMGTSTWLFFREREALAQTELARQRETELRRHAQDSERITQAAIYVSQGKFAEADHALDGVSDLIRPSIDGINAYRQVAEWLAFQGHWKKAGERFSKLIAIDEVGTWPVTWDYQSCGSVMAESGDRGGYARFCQTAIARFTGTTNSNEAWRIVRACLLVPADSDRLASLRPLIKMSESAYNPWPPANVGAAWGTIPLALWYYRNGNYSEAERWCQRTLVLPDHLSARDGILLMIKAMACFQLGRGEEARADLAQGQAIIASRFDTIPRQDGAMHDLRWDWVDARILQREAINLIGENVVPADPNKTPTLPR